MRFRQREAFSKGRSSDAAAESALNTSNRHAYVRESRPTDVQPVRPFGGTPDMRPNTLAGFAALLLTALVSASAQQPAPVKPQVVPAVSQTKETQAAITPGLAMQMLKDGNARFVSGTMKKRDLTK